MQVAKPVNYNALMKIQESNVEGSSKSFCSLGLLEEMRSATSSQMSPNDLMATLWNWKNKGLAEFTGKLSFGEPQPMSMPSLVIHTRGFERPGNRL